MTWPLIFIVTMAAAGCYGIYLEMRAHEMVRKAEHDAEILDLEFECKEAHAGMLVVDERKRKAMAARRQLDYELWRGHFREAEHERFIRKTRAFWDGKIRFQGAA